MAGVVPKNMAELGITDLKRKIVALVCLKPRMTVAPDIIFQVTIDPSKISPSGKYIRFDAANSEVNGWQPIEAVQILEILEVLGDCEGVQELAFKGPAIQIEQWMTVDVVPKIEVST